MEKNQKNKKQEKPKNSGVWKWISLPFLFAIPASILSNQLVLEPGERNSFCKIFFPQTIFNNLFAKFP